MKIAGLDSMLGWMELRPRVRIRWLSQGHRGGLVKSRRGD